MKRFGLKPEIIEKILAVLKQYPEIHKIIVYGSRAKGSYKPGSDIDLTLDAPSMDVSTLLKIENELDDLLLPYKIDLSVLQHVDNKELREHIERVGADFSKEYK